MDWYVIYTHSCKEFFSEKNLNRLNFFTYVPKFKKKINHARKITIEIKPLFPRYIFVKLNLDTQRWSVINSTYGVKNLLIMNNEPIKIANDIINKLKSYEDEQGIIIFYPNESLTIGDRIKIESGAFAGKNGFYEGLAKDNKIKVLLNLLGKDITLAMTQFSVVK